MYLHAQNTQISLAGADAADNMNGTTQIVTINSEKYY